MLRDDVSKDEFKVPATDIELIKYVAKWIQRAQGTCVAMSDMANDEGLKAEGVLQGLDLSIGAAKKRAEAEGDKAEGQREAAKDAKGGEVTPIRPGISERPTGVRPEQSEADQRKANDKPNGKPTRRRRKPPKG